MFRLIAGENWVRRVACGLYALTYDNDVDEERVIQLIRNETMFKEYYLRFFNKKKSYKGIYHKRLWAALRDYLTGYMHQHISEWAEDKVNINSLKLWKNARYYLYQLELPGDIWNQRFKENIIDKMLPGYEKMPVSKVIRLLYERYGGKDLYPIQFDVTFTFYQRMCKEKIFCDLCPLGPSGGEKLCIENSPRDKYCPVLAFAFGYLKTCEIGDCPVYKRLIKGVCPAV